MYQAVEGRNGRRAGSNLEAWPYWPMFSRYTLYPITSLNSVISWDWVSKHRSQFRTVHI